MYIKVLRVHISVCMIDVGSRAAVAFLLTIHFKGNQDRYPVEKASIFRRRCRSPYVLVLLVFLSGACIVCTLVIIWWHADLGVLICFLNHGSM